jgi:hypothetical protein
MNYPTFSRAVALGGFGLLSATTVSRATILVSLDPATALYDSNIRGVVNDGGSGPGDPAGHLSGIPVLDTAEHPNGFTFNIAFVPNAADLTGTRLLIEIGGTSNGSGLYLVDGVPVLIGKQGATDAALPTSLTDTTLNTIAVKSSIGKLTAGLAYSVSASWNHAGTLELRAGEDGGPSLLDSFAISGTPGNWSGNDTLSVKTLGKANAGGLSGNNATNVFGPPYDVDNASSLEGSVSRALFWNAHAVTPLTLTPPVVRGFSATRLPVANKVRLHWNVSEGGLANPTTLSIKDTATDTVVFTPASLTGFADLPAGTTGFTLTATNATGVVTGTSTLEVDNSFSAVVRADSPSAWFRFNEVAGSSLLADSAENAVPHDGVLLGQSVSGGSSFIDGAGAFEGGSSQRTISILNPAVVGTGPRAGFTIETIVRRRVNAAGNHVLVSQTDQDGIGRVILGINEAGTIYSNIGVTALTAEGAPTVPLERKEADEKLEVDRWAHLVVVVDPGISGTPGTAEIRWYLDGKKIGSTLDGVNPDGSTFTRDFLIEPSTGNWIIGAAKTQLSEFWKGDIDDIAIYPNLLDDPDKNGDTADSTIAAHHASWYARTSGILSFKASSTTVNTGGSVEFTVRAGADVTAVSIDNGVGTVPLVDGVGTITVSPSATTTYRLTATGAGGVTTTRDVVVTYQQLTVPVILGLEKTTLPATGQVRVHWRVSPGAFNTPVTIGITSGSTTIPTDNSLVGFADLSASDAASITLTATNLIGPVSLADNSAAAADTTYSAAVRADSPVAWFRFNEKTGSQLVVDSAENVRPHNGTPLNASSISTGATGFVDGAGTFDGTRGVITDRIVNLNEIEEGFTIEAIVRNEPDAAGTANRAIVSQLDQNGTGRLIISVDDTGTIRSVFGGGVRKDADTKVIGQTWSHVVVVANAVTNTLRWYVDGQYAGTSADGVNPDGSTFDPNLLFEASEGAWTIGVHKTLTGNFWKGQIDEIAIYDTILDEVPGATPEDPVVVDGTRILAHRNAWYGETSGLLHAGLSAATIEPGDSTQLTLKVGYGITSVTIDGLGTFPVVDGTVVITLTPSATTIYQVTLNGAGGPFVVPVTVTVNSVVPHAPLTVTSWTKTEGSFVLSFTGTPNTVYHIRGSTDLDSFAIDHGTATTDPSGAASATITIDPLRKQEFYRVQSQP